MSGLVLSLFPGIDVLGRGFELEGWTVVRGPEPLFGWGSVLNWTPPAGRFDGVIGGPPCQAYSRAATIGRPKKPAPRLVGEFARIVEAAAPRWFLMENVRGCPGVQAAGYTVGRVLVHNRDLGQEQMRARLFWFGRRGKHELRDVNLDRWLDREALHVSEKANVVRASGAYTGARREFTTNDGRRRSEPMNSRATVASVREAIRLQGLPEGFLGGPDGVFTAAGQQKLVGNAVPLPMARAVAVAVGRALSARG